MKIALPRPAPPFNVMAVVTPLVIELRPGHGQTLLEITKPSSGGYRSFRTKLCTCRFNCGFRRCSYDIQLHTGLTHGYFSALSWYQLKPKAGDITLHSCFLVHLLTLCHTTGGAQNSKVDCLLRTLTSPSGHL